MGHHIRHRPMRTRFLLAALVAATLVGARAEAADLTVRVVGLRSFDGVIRLGLFDSPAEFPSRTSRIKGGSTEAAHNPAVFVFRDLAPGAYAVAVYHDENANNVFDFTWLGLPAEGYGFSNDAMGFFSAPSFESAAVSVEGDTTITITLN